MINWFEHLYPYSNLHELNLDWIIQASKKLYADLETFRNLNSLTFSDPILWNITTQYSRGTIVLNSTGDAFVSKEIVPAGIQLDNSDYWEEIFNFADYVRTANSNLTFNVEIATERASQAYDVGDWLIWNDVLYKVTSAIDTDDLFVIGTNIVHFTVEDFIKAWITYATNLINQYKNDIDASELAYKNQLDGVVNQYKSDIDYSEAQYKAQLDASITSTTATMQAQLNTAIAGATVDSETINARVGVDNERYGTLRDAIITQIFVLLQTKQDVEYTKPLVTLTEHNGYFYRVTTGEEVADAGSTYCIETIDPTESPIIYVSGMSQTNMDTIPLVAFLDSNDDVISKFGNASTYYDKVAIFVPKNAVKVVLNTRYGTPGNVYMRKFTYTTPVSYSRDMYYQFFENSGNPILSVYVRSKYSNKYVKYVFYHYINNSIHFDCWRLWDIRICDSSMNELYTLIAGASSANASHNIECEGAIKEEGVTDFIGGYHGDEYMDDVSIFIDGVQIALNTDIGLTKFNDKIELYVRSHLNRCDTSTPILKRSKIDTVDIDGFHIKNVFCALTNINISRAPLSMLNVPTENVGGTTLIDSFNSDARDELMVIDDLTQTQKDNLHNISLSPAIRDGFYHGALVVDVKIRDILNGQNTRGFFQWFENGAWAPSVKIYQDVIYNSTVHTDEWFGCTSHQSIWPM